MLKRLNKNRRGVECVEVALTLPLLLIAIFATVAIAHRWHLEKMIKLATYEAIKVGCAVDGDAEDAKRIFSQHVAAMGIEGATLNIDEDSFNDAKVGDLLRLRGTAPISNNRLLAPVSLSLDPNISGGWVFYRKESL